MNEMRSRVMGSELHIAIVDGQPELLVDADRRLDQLEARWSRFLPRSELSRINAADGDPVVVSTDTIHLVEGLRAAWHHTNGRFDPTVYDAMIAAGYDRPWPEPRPMLPPGAATSSTNLQPLGRVADRAADSGSIRPASEWLVMRLGAETGLVQLPAGTHLDPGGLGKGLAADLVAAELVAAGAAGALVSIGGDIRVTGTPPDGDAWRIDIEHPDDRGRTIARVRIVEGGIATSTCARRRWLAADGTPQHHLIDPITGRPANRAWRQVTTVAGSAAWAEVAAKVTYLDGRPSDPFTSALLVGADDALTTVGDGSIFQRLTERAVA